MSDLISRADLFDELNRRGVPYNAEVNMIINGMPSVQPKAQLSTKDTTFDCISRQAAIDEIDEWIKAFRENGHKESAADACLIQDGIIQLPSAQQWIPCSERLPEEYGEYRITWTTSASKNRLIGDAEYEVTGEWDEVNGRFKGEWLLEEYIKNYPNVEVLAWKPLEEPWKGEQP